jgi:hypothetical protein
VLAVVLACAAAAWLVLAFVSFSGPGSTTVEAETASVGASAAGSLAWAYDYEAYVKAAQRLTESGSPYQAETLAGPFRPGPYGLYLYSPALAVMLLPATSTSLEVGAVLWFLLHVLVLAGAVALMPLPGWLRLATFGVAALSFAVLRDLVLGNVSVLLLLPMAMTWRWLDRPLGAGGLALALAIRPTLGIVLLWQLLRRQWRAVAWTVGLGLLLIAATLPFVGLGGYLDYLAVLRNMSDVTGVYRNQDISTTLLGLGASREVAEVGLMAGYAIAIGAVLAALRRDRETGYMVAVTASLLLSPLLWDHYLATLVIPAAFLAQRWTPLALGIPLLSWAPEGLYAVTIVVVLALLLLAPREAGGPAPVGSRAPEPGFHPSSA